MKAAFIESTGAPDVIRYGDLPDPQPKEGEVRVKVAAVAVNPIDTYIRGGAVQMPLPKPFVIGCDLAGVVEKVGPGAKRFKVGDRVWGSNQGLLGRQGTFAELVCTVPSPRVYVRSALPPGASAVATNVSTPAGLRSTVPKLDGGLLTKLTWTLSPGSPIPWSLASRSTLAEPPLATSS